MARPSDVIRVVSTVQEFLGENDTDCIGGDDNLLYLFSEKITEEDVKLAGMDEKFISAGWIYNESPGFECWEFPL